MVLLIRIGDGFAVDPDRSWCGAVDPDRGWWCCGSGWVTVVLWIQIGAGGAVDQDG